WCTPTSSRAPATTPNGTPDSRSAWARPASRCSGTGYLTSACCTNRTCDSSSSSSESMKISYRWLRALVPELADSPERIAERLAMCGAPVEEMVRLAEGLTDVVVARVAAVRPHPNADRLSLCTVDAGGEPVEVVCGAPNVRAG